MVRPIGSADGPRVVRQLEDAFGGVGVARKSVLIDVSVLPGLVATDWGRPVGLLSYDVTQGEWEVVATLSTQSQRVGQSDDEVDHMRRVVSYVHRHQAQEPSGDLEDSTWRYSLMNWGHDPLK